MQDQQLSTDPDPRVAYTLYDMTIQPGIFYQPHPAFARDAKADFFIMISEENLANVHTLADFKYRRYP